MTLKLGRLLADPAGEDGQGVTEYAVVIALVLVTLGVGLGLLGGAIETFMSKVVVAIEDLT
jgi:Flp pilus assembly pilin Flp